MIKISKPEFLGGKSHDAVGRVLLAKVITIISLKFPSVCLVLQTQILNNEMLLQEMNKISIFKIYQCLLEEDLKIDSKLFRQMCNIRSTKAHNSTKALFLKQDVNKTSSFFNSFCMFLYVVIPVDVFWATEFVSNYSVENVGKKTIIKYLHLSYLIPDSVAKLRHILKINMPWGNFVLEKYLISLTLKQSFVQFQTLNAFTYTILAISFHLSLTW